MRMTRMTKREKAVPAKALNTSCSWCWRSGVLALALRSYGVLEFGVTTADPKAKAFKMVRGYAYNTGALRLCNRPSLKILLLVANES